MSFDITALNAFRNVNLGGEKAIANLGEGFTGDLAYSVCRKDWFQ